jgi:hypothetical protein
VRLLNKAYERMLEDLQNGLISFRGGADRPINPAEGYNETADILTQTIDGVPIDQLYEEFNSVLALYNRQRAPLVEALTFTVNAPFEQVMQATTADFEEADEWGQPVGIRLGRPWTMGYDLRYFDLGIRFTFRFLGRAPASQIRALQNEALDADARLIYRTVFNQLFNNVTKTATLEDTGTVVNVYPLYNADNPVAPPSWKTYNHTTTHTHYLVSGNATVRSVDLDNMETHIYHHGYEEGSDLILLVNTEQFNTIRKFKVASNDSYDFIPAGVSPMYPFLGTMVGTPPTAPAGGISTYPGFQGKYGRWNVFVEDMITAKYMLGFATRGPRNPDNLVGLREHEHPGLRGLKLIPQYERYPLRESFYHHAIGSGVRHRGAGVVMFIDAGATYVVPAPNYGGPGGR